MILTKIAVFVGRGLLGTGESISDECGHWKHRTSWKYHLRVSVQCVAFTLCKCVFHDFDQKLLFSSGEVFTEQASRYQTSVVSLEVRNIIEVPFKGLGSMCCVYFV